MDPVHQFRGEGLKFRRVAMSFWLGSDSGVQNNSSLKLYFSDIGPFNSKMLGKAKFWYVPRKIQKLQSLGSTPLKFSIGSTRPRPSRLPGQCCIWGNTAENFSRDTKTQIYVNCKCRTNQRRYGYYVTIIRLCHTHRACLTWLCSKLGDVRRIYMMDMKIISQKYCP